MSQLSNVAMLADFSVSKPDFRKIDKERSAELTDNAGAVRKSAHVSKKLIMSDTLVMIDRLVTRARAFHAAHTSPWLDNGARILSVHNFETYEAGMAALENEFRTLVPVLLANYPTYVEQAKRLLGDLFEPRDYPSVERVEAKFAWRQTIFALPDSDDFRANVSQASADKIRADMSAAMTRAIDVAVRDVFERVHDNVSRMVESLSGFDPAKSGKERGTFRDTMVTNIRDLVDLMPGLNFSGNPDITKLASDMSALCQFDAEDLRVSDNIRADTLAKAMDIVNAVSDFMA